jgi:hypothetical protein
MAPTAYKEFFDLTDYLSTDNLDFSYRKTVINQDNIPKETLNQSLVSFEKIQANNMLGIYKYLKYKLSKKKKEKPTENITQEDIRNQILWFEKNINFFEHKLSNIENSCTFITPEHAFFCKHYEKISYSKEQKAIGRLYNNTSIQTLPREIRYYLFKDEYVDFDMVNAHPSIMLLFCKEHNLKLNGSLEEYVSDRSSVILQIKTEMLSLKKKELSNAEIKTLVLKYLNRTWTKKEGELSGTIGRLDEDFSVARDHLWSMYKSGALSIEYAQALKSSLRKKNILEDQNTTALEKISLQSFYCQTMETFHLLRFVEYLREKYSESLKKQGIVDFKHFYPITDKKVDLPAEYSLTVVPFFDGVYVSSPLYSFNDNLVYFVDEYNKNNKTSVFFETKEIERNDNHLTEETELSDFLVIHRWLTKPESKKSFNTLIAHLRLLDDFFQKLAEKEEYFDESSDSDEKWEEEYKEIVNSMHFRLYDELLKHSFFNETEINAYITSLSSKTTNTE